MPSYKRPQMSFKCKKCGEITKRDRYRVLSGEANFCSQKCYHADKQNWTPDKFWGNIAKKKTGCWHWNGKPLQIHGYGRVRVRNKQIRAHRYAWEITNGKIPKGLWVLHKCDNRICVNPKHLFLGDASDNMRDMANKGRAAGFKRKGEKHPMSKLNKEIVKKYRNKWVKRGRYGNGKVLAGEVGISYAYFVSVMNGRVACWK